MPRIDRFDVLAPSKAARRAFDCGHESLNNWFATQAGQSMRSRDAITFVLHEGDEILGYYCVAAATVELEHLATGRRRGAPDLVPAAVIGRLAVTVDGQGKGFGRTLLRHAIKGALIVSETMGIRCMLVHAIDETARDFYEHNGFERSVLGQFTLLLHLDDVRRSLGR